MDNKQAPKDEVTKNSKDPPIAPFKVEKVTKKRTFPDANDENQGVPRDLEVRSVAEDPERTFGRDVTWSTTVNKKSTLEFGDIPMRKILTKSHECRYANCGKSFSRRSGRSRHEKIHKGKETLKKDLGRCDRTPSFKDVRAKVNHRHY